MLTVPSCIQRLLLTKQTEADQLATHCIVLKLFLEVGAMLAVLQVQDISAGLCDFSKTRESGHTTRATPSLSTPGCSPPLMSSQLLSCCCPKMMTASARLRCRAQLNAHYQKMSLASS